MCKFRTLRADEIECRVSKVGNGYVTCLLYKTARTDMDLLDETVGALNWSCDYEEVHGNLFCTISIYDEKRDRWIKKSNCGIESREDNGNEKKGEASDAMKRAGFCWGIGRELYTAPSIFIRTKTIDDKGNKINHYYDVAEIVYDNSRRISHLVLTEKGSIVFEWEADTFKNSLTDTSVQMLKNQIISLADGDMDRIESYVSKRYPGMTFDQLSADELKDVKLKVLQYKKDAPVKGGPDVLETIKLAQKVN